MMQNQSGEDYVDTCPFPRLSLNTMDSLNWYSNFYSLVLGEVILMNLKLLLQKQMLQRNTNDYITSVMYSLYTAYILIFYLRLDNTIKYSYIIIYYIIQVIMADCLILRK